MKDPGNIREVAEISPDMMGFIFYPGSKRFVGEDFVMPEISSEIQKVGVFVNDQPENIIDKVKKYRLDIVQLHGDEPPELCRRIAHSAEVIKAFGIDELFDFSMLSKYENCCNYFLFDTKTTAYGGTGQKFDWSLLKNYYGTKSYFLSGGIGLDEASHLKSFVPTPFAVDINSKFETNPGIKDIHKLKKFKDELSGK